jgi:hypothetical protein
MHMLASRLIMASAAIILALGFVHLVYTYCGSKLRPRDPALQAAMNDVHPYISRQTTMWKAWVGFNASHSFGGMLFGLVYGYLALYHPQMLLSSVFLLAVGLGMLAGLTLLAKMYWFRIPLSGIALALFLYVSGTVVSRI